MGEQPCAVASAAGDNDDDEHLPHQGQSAPMMEINDLVQGHFGGHIEGQEVKVYEEEADDVIASWIKDETTCSNIQQNTIVSDQSTSRHMSDTEEERARILDEVLYSNTESTLVDSEQMNVFIDDDFESLFAFSS